MLVASAHTANSDLSFGAVQSYSQTLAQRIVNAFDDAVVERIAVLLPTSDTPAKPTTFDEAYADLELIPPSILHVVVNPDGYANLSGVATPGVEVLIRSQRKVLGKTNVLPSGQWKLRLDAPLEHGVHRMWSVARLPDNGHLQPGQDVRIALPQTLSQPLVVLDALGGGGLDATAGLDNARAAGHQTDVTPATGSPHTSTWRLMQVGARDGSRQDRQSSRPQFDDQDRGFTAPVFAWLQRSAIAYDRLIVDDLSGGARGLRYVMRGRDASLDTEFGEDGPQDDAFRDRSERRFTSRDGTLGLGERWQSLRVGVVEWFRQAQLSYRDNVVEPLSTGERETRDRFARAEPEPVPSRPLRRRDQRPVDPIDEEEDWTLPEPTSPSPSTAETQPKEKDPFANWPVVRDDTFELPQLPDVTPDPEKEVLIRKAEEDAEKARQLARLAAEQAEAARKATEALLEEEKRLQNDAVARRAAAKQAAAEADLKRRADEAEKRAAAAEARAKEAERLAANAKSVEEDQAARKAAQRKMAEDLAAAASAAADREFAAGRVSEPPVATDPEAKVAQVQPAPATPSDREDVQPSPQPGSPQFTVADLGASPRLSIKDNASDAVVEEGSTMGNVDDFDPSVRYVYDMGDGGALKATRKVKRRSAKKRRARSRSAKRKTRYRKHARKRRAAKVRSYRKRRVRAKRRARVRRAYRRNHRRVHRLGRRFKFKARRRVHYRRHAYVRSLFIPRLRWRRW